MFSRIIGTGSYLPEKIVTNQDFEEKLDTSNEWIIERSGIESRRVANSNEFASDMASEAAKKAMGKAGVGPNDIDLIIVATTTPDMVFPSTACILQSKLGVKTCIAFDMQAVCTGFVYSLNMADLFIKSGQASKALVVGAEVYSRILDYTDRSTCVLFGDGAGAVVLSESSEPGLISSKLHANGQYKDFLSVPGWLRNGKSSGSPYVQMNGPAVFKFAVKAFVDVSKETLNSAKRSTSDVDWFIPHQANTRIMDAAIGKLKINKEKLVSTVKHHGNTSAASIPLALDEYVDRKLIKKGDNILLAGVGGGFTWGGIFLTF